VDAKDQVGALDEPRRRMELRCIGGLPYQMLEFWEPKDPQTPHDLVRNTFLDCRQPTKACPIYTATGRRTEAPSYPGHLVVPPWRGSHDAKPSRMNVWVTSGTRSSEVDALGGDLGHVHARGAPRRHLGPAPLDHRAPTSPHDAPQVIPLVVGDVSDPNALNGAPRCATRRSKWWARPRNVAGHGTSCWPRLLSRPSPPSGRAPRAVACTPPSRCRRPT